MTKEEKEEKKKKSKDKLKELFAIALKQGINLTRGTDLKPFVFVGVGIPQLDALRFGARGKYTILYGPTGSAKSTLIYRAIAAHQKKYPDLTPLYVSAEDRVDPAWMETQGVDLENLVVLEGCETLEDYCDGTRRLIETGKISMVAVDSISAMVPRAMFEEKPSEKNTMNRNHIGVDATKIGQFIKLTTHLISKHDVTTFLVAQARVHGIGSIRTYVGLSGGHMLKHMAIQIWQLTPMLGATQVKKAKIIGFDGKQIETIKEFTIRALLEKDTGPNWRKAAFMPFVVGAGYDDTTSATKAAIRLGCVEKRGKEFFWKDDKGVELNVGDKETISNTFASLPVELERLKVAVALAYQLETKEVVPDENEPKWVEGEEVEVDPSAFEQEDEA